MERGQFEELVERALEELPEQFRERLSNIDVEVEDYPSADDLRVSGARRGQTLLGLYRGVPQTRRGIWYNFVPPDRIIIYQRPIELSCRNSEEIVEKVGHVFRHEIAHHFGIDDETLRQMGAY
ncbi:MAG: metallopeptidase family protein [Dehalococcoidia bacterium]|jgi:predicted Zn-dependent protease with MMP-like domain